MGYVFGILLAWPIGSVHLHLLVILQALSYLDALATSVGYLQLSVSFQAMPVFDGRSAGGRQFLAEGFAVRSISKIFGIQDLGIDTAESAL